MIVAALVLLAVAALLFLARVVAGPTLADRVLALDGLVTCVVAFIVAEAARRGSDLTLGVAVVAAFVGFIGASVAARFIERRGA